MNKIVDSAYQIDGGVEVPDGRYRFSAYVDVKGNVMTFPKAFGNFKERPNEPFDMGPCIQLESCNGIRCNEIVEYLNG